MEEGRLPKGVLEWRPSGRRKRGRPKLKITGQRGLEEGWEKRGYRKDIVQKQLEEKDSIMVKRAQEDGNIVQPAK
jgi:hypothetical protein